MRRAELGLEFEPEVANLFIEFMLGLAESGGAVCSSLPSPLSWTAAATSSPLWPEAGALAGIYERRGTQLIIILNWPLPVGGGGGGVVGVDVGQCRGPRLNSVTFSSVSEPLMKVCRNQLFTGARGDVGAKARPARSDDTL